MVYSLVIVPVKQNIQEEIEKRKEEDEKRRRQRHLDVKRMQVLEDENLNYDPLKVVTREDYILNSHWQRKRSSSISDPSKLSKRLNDVRTNVKKKTKAKRRYSLPDRVEKISIDIEYKSDKLKRKQILESLNLFTNRNAQLEILFKELKNWDYIKFEQEDTQTYSAEDIKGLEKAYNSKLRRGLCSGALNVRLPMEERDIIVNTGRRRTIGAPERFFPTVDVLMETRKKFSRLFEAAQSKFSVDRRRRSFDFGEDKDHAQGITDAVGYKFERQEKEYTSLIIDKDAKLMHQLMVKAGYGMHYFEDEENVDKMSITSSEYSDTTSDEFDNFHNIFSDDYESHKIKGYASSFAATNDVLKRKEEAIGQDEFNEYEAKENIWQEHYTDEIDEDGNPLPYYYNAFHDISQFDLPEGDDIQMEVQTEDNKGGLYWLNLQTDEIRPINIIGE